MTKQQIINILLELGFIPILDTYVHTHNGVVTNFLFRQDIWEVSILGKSITGIVEFTTDDSLYRLLADLGFKTNANY